MDFVPDFAKLKKALPSPTPKFGVANIPENERKCDLIHVFMSCYGYSTLGMIGDTKRQLMDPNITLRQARENFGRKSFLVKPKL